MRAPLLHLIAVVVAFGTVAPARADVIWSGGTPSGEQSVTLVTGTSGTFLGGSTFQIVGTLPGAIPVDISTNNSGSSGVDHLFAFSTTDLYANPVGSSDTSIDQLTFSIPGFTFSDMAANLFGMLDTTTSAFFTVVTNDGTFTHTYTGLGSSDNPILITTDNGETIESVSLSDTRFFALKNLNISGASPVPEPASVLLLGTGLAGLMGVARRRLRR